MISTYDLQQDNTKSYAGTNDSLRKANSISKMYNKKSA
jgi:hypothetical protein